MKIPYQVPCPNCSETVEVKAELTENNFVIECPRCGVQKGNFFDSRFHIGQALIYYSTYALASGDTNFSILLSAMAMDCYLSRLYYKWTEIQELKGGSPFNPEEIEKKIGEEFIKIGNFLDKVKKVEALIFPAGTSSFIESHSDLQDEIKTDFPSVLVDSFVKDMRNEIMWKRNNIVHIGNKKYRHDEAWKCLNYAEFFIKVFEKIEEAKSREIGSEIIA
ncbi:MAG: hypothetical protein A2Y97_08515 [Nitrospirae bacterium RBG_13_39_12]|nr:MAG: hypothetical protein A2Y97_08515 [Nitrospirae bacterium RBG_13_39_12]